jgi:hypothetical protein
VIISLNSINQLIFEMVKCFLCGTDWIHKYYLNERPEVAPHINVQISPNAALPRIISKFKIMHERRKTLLNFSPCSTSHPTFSTSKRRIFTKPTFTRRTSGHCLGTFVATNLNLCSPVKSSAYRYYPPFSLLSLSLLRLHRVKNQSEFSNAVGLLLV